MTIHPRRHKDLMLAPIAAEIDSNRQRTRDQSILALALGLSAGITGYVEAGVAA